MSNFREVNDDILKDWLLFREETLFDFLSDNDKKCELNFDVFCERVLRFVTMENKEVVEKEFDRLYEDFMNYLGYWNEKYYRNGFCDGVKMIMGCIEE